MKQNIFKMLMLAALTLCSVSLNARCVKVKSSRSSGAPELKVDSIDYRADLTRVYGVLTGTPHTSHRIDAIKLLHNGAIATDVDGIDFKRWFQWEDEGELRVEIDFPAMKQRSAIVMEASTPRGTTVWTVETQPNKVIKRKKAVK